MMNRLSMPQAVNSRYVDDKNISRDQILTARS